MRRAFATFVLGLTVSSRQADRSPTTVLIDDYLPRYDVRERHSLRVRASAVHTYAALRSTDLARGSIVRALLLLRAVPGAIGHGGGGFGALRQQRASAITLATFEERGFRVVAERPPTELLIGLEGQFWRLDGGICTPPSDEFLDHPPNPGTARAVWNFSLEELPSGGTELRTETRVLCADGATRRHFLPYWFLIRAGSGIIRHAMLRAIRSEAESRARMPR